MFLFLLLISKYYKLLELAIIFIYQEVPLDTMDKSIHLRLPKILYKESEKIKKEFGFSNVQEFIKEAIRKTILEYKRQRALNNLKKNFGSVKNIKRLSKEELNKVALAFTPEKDKEIAKRYDLEEVTVK